MEDIIEVIKTRRSVRRYKKENIPRATVMEILEAGRWAPSSSNNQPWRFVVIDDENTIQKITSESMAFGINLFIRYAPLIIVIYSFEKHRWVDLDCGICAENMMLEAHSLGVGSCFIGAFNEHGVKNILGIPVNANVIGLIAFGFPAVATKVSTRLSIDDLTSFNRASNYIKKPSFARKLVFGIASKLFGKRSF